MRKSVTLFLLGLYASLSSHAALPFEQLLYKGRAIPFYNDSQNAGQQKYIEGLKTNQFAEGLSTMVNSTLHIKRNVGVGIESCGTPNAFFEPRRQAIVICSEFIEMVVNTAKNDNEFMMKLSKDQFAKGVAGALIGVFMHELAHAIIHVNQVAVTGREEDVADQFSVWFAVNFVDVAKVPIITPTIWLWGRLAKERNIPNMTDEQRKAFFSNEHSLDEQRVYNLACWAYGTGTENGAKTARFARLPEQRAQRCPGEYAQVDFGMKKNFKKFFKIRPLTGNW